MNYLYIVIGFIIYYVIVKKLIPFNTIQNKNLNQLAQDIIKIQFIIRPNKLLITLVCAL